jgi:rhamnosyltransferase
MNTAVLLASRNGEKWIATQIQSILDQKLDYKIDIYISDDCSSDSTLTLVDMFVRRANIYIFSKNVRYGSPCSNFIEMIRGVDLSNYDYVFLSDQDDIWLPEKMSVAINYIELNGFDCYASALTCFYENKKSRHLNKSSRQTKYDYFFQGASAGCTYAFNKKSISAVKKSIEKFDSLFFLDISHDWLLYAITRSRNFKWFIDEKSFINYRQHSFNSWGALGLKSYIKRFGLIRDRWYYHAIRKNILLLEENKENKRILLALSRNLYIDRLYLVLNIFRLRRSLFESLTIGLLIIFNLA